MEQGRVTRMRKREQMMVRKVGQRERETGEGDEGEAEGKGNRGG